MARLKIVRSKQIGANLLLDQFSDSRLGLSRQNHIFQFARRYHFRYKGAGSSCR